jgi:hypothetical protein
LVSSVPSSSADLDEDLTARPVVREPGLSGDISAWSRARWEHARINEKRDNLAIDQRAVAADTDVRLQMGKIVLARDSDAGPIDKFDDKASLAVDLDGGQLPIFSAGRSQIRTNGCGEFCDTSSDRAGDEFPRRRRRPSLRSRPVHVGPHALAHLSRTPNEAAKLPQR